MNDASTRSTPFFERFPALAGRLPHTPIGVFPTPVHPLAWLAREIGPVASAHVKDDGVSSSLYGGNKVRKLEFVLGEALRRGAREVMTFGFAGSNHAAATAVHAAALGLRSISMLLPQARAPYVAANLEVSAAVGAELHYYRTLPNLAVGIVQQTATHQLRTGRRPFVIAPGGSSPLGTVGFVAAAFELAAQLVHESLPPPDVVYVPLGSCGTAVGLAIGLAVSRMPTSVVAVRVTEQNHANEQKATKLWRETVALLRTVDPSFPSVELDRSRLAIRDDFFGGCYASVTPAAAEAIELMRSNEGIDLDGTYTGKTLACLISDCRRGALAGRHVLFWNTYNAADLSCAAARATRDRLPRALQAYLAGP